MLVKMAAIMFGKLTRQVSNGILNKRWPFSSELKVNLYQIELIVMLGRVLLQFISEFKEIELLHKTVWAPFRRNMHEKRKVQNVR